MDSIPYELLQMVAEYLLPRYQCRLALVSHYYYKYLYSDLLKWHARKSFIPIPKYKIHTHWYRRLCISIRECNGILCINSIKNGDLYIDNYTKYGYLIIVDTITGKTRITTGSWEVMIETFIKYYGIRVFDGFYKYMHTNALKRIMPIYKSPLLSLPSHILYIIKCSTPKGTIYWPQVHSYLDSII